MVRAGWTGRRPRPASGWLHLAFVGAGSACAIAATGGGAPILTPLALLTAAVQTPYALDQLALQNAATGHHAQNPHYFDMAWLVVTFVVMLLAAAMRPDLRRLAVWAGAGAG